MILFLKCALVLVLLLLLAGVLFEQYSRLRLERKWQGKTFVKIHNNKIHYVKKGQGDHTIVFQSGMGSSHFIWDEIQDSLSKKAVTISYDRNGLMYSDRTDERATNDQVSDELFQLLKKTNCPKPYILVGHSMAGIYMRPFIAQHHDDIKGIVFVEAAHPKQIEKASPALIKALQPPPRWLIKTAIHTGIYRAFFSFQQLNPEIPLKHPLGQLEKDFFFRSVDKTLEELALDQQNFRDAEKYTDFGDIPLTVIMGMNEIRYRNFKNQALAEEYRSLVHTVQHDLLQLSPHSKLVKAHNSGHIVQINDASLLVQEIEKLIR